MAINTPEFRVSYPSVFKTAVNQLSKKEEYSVVAFFPKDADLSALKNAALEAAKKKWGDKYTQIMNSPGFNSPFRKTKKDGSVPQGLEEGGTFMNLKSAQKPGVVDQNVQDILDSSQFYAGCYARASVNAYAYDQAGTRGIAFGLNNLQKLRDGDPLGGRAPASVDFKPVAMSNDQPADSLFN